MTTVRTNTPAGLGPALRQWWHTHGPLTRAMAAAAWPTCATFAAATPILRRVVPFARAGARRDLVLELPTLTRDDVPAAVALGPEVVTGCLRRPDCTPRIAAGFVREITAGSAPTDGRQAWAWDARLWVYQALGQQGWSLWELVPDLWPTIMAPLTESRYVSPAVAAFWTLARSVPRLPDAVFAELVAHGYLPEREQDSLQILTDARLSAAQRQTLFVRLVRTTLYGGTPSGVSTMDWSLPGAKEGLVESLTVGVTTVNAPISMYTDAARHRRTTIATIHQALRAASVAERAAWWDAVGRAPTDAAARTMKGLWQVARADLLRWDDGVSAMLQYAWPDERLAVLTALGERAARGSAPTAPEPARGPGAPADAPGSLPVGGAEGPTALPSPARRSDPSPSPARAGRRR